MEVSEMKRLCITIACSTVVFSALTFAGTPLSVQESAKIGLPKLQKYASENHNSWGYSVQYIKHNTFNKNLLHPTYGTVRELFSGYLTLDPSAEQTAQCVTFVKTVTVNSGSASSWKRGAAVNNSTPKWSVIAKFKGNTTYPTNGTGHVAILYKNMSNGRAYVIDQNYDNRTSGNHKAPGLLAIRYIKASERDEYHVVEK